MKRVQRVKDIYKRQVAVVSDDNLWKMQLQSRRVLLKRIKLFRASSGTLVQIFAGGEKGATDYGDCRSPIKVAPATWRWVEWYEGIKPPNREKRTRGWLGEKRVDSERRKSGSNLPCPLFLLRGRTRRCQATGIPLSSSTLKDVTQGIRKENELLTFRGPRLTWTVASWRTSRGTLVEPTHHFFLFYARKELTLANCEFFWIRFG